MSTLRKLTDAEEATFLNAIMDAYKRANGFTSIDPFLKASLETEVNTLRMFWKAGINGKIQIEVEDG